MSSTSWIFDRALNSKQWKCQKQLYLCLFARFIIIEWGAWETWPFVNDPNVPTTAAYLNPVTKEPIHFLFANSKLSWFMDVSACFLYYGGGLILRYRRGRGVLSGQRTREHSLCLCSYILGAQHKHNGRPRSVPVPSSSVSFLPIQSFWLLVCNI